MARYLSPEWFQEVRERGPGPIPAREVRLLLRQVVTATPEGVVSYHVAVGLDRAVITDSPPRVADLTFTSDWSTAAAIASGALSTQSALLEGRIRVAGDLSKLEGSRCGLAGLDAVPEAVRAETTY